MPEHDETRVEPADHIDEREQERRSREAAERELKRETEDERRSVAEIERNDTVIRVAWEEVETRADVIASDDGSRVVRPVREDIPGEAERHRELIPQWESIRRHVLEIEEAQAVESATSVRWNKRRFVVAILGLVVGTTGAVLGYLARLLSGDAQAGAELPTAVQQALVKLADRLKRQSDDEYWEGIAAFVDATKPRPTLLDQVYFCAYTVTLFSYQIDTWTWGDTKDILEVVLKFEQLYADQGKHMPSVYRHIGDVKYGEKLLPRAIAAKYLSWALIEIVSKKGATGSTS